MKYQLLCLAASAVLLLIPNTLLAQDSDFHPAISESFMISMGAFRSDNAFKIRAEDQTGDFDDIDFPDSLGVDDHSTLVVAQFRWKFGSTRKWSLWGQYFSNNAKGEIVLKDDIDWEELTFGAGSFVGAGVGFDVTRVFIGRSFVLNDQHDFGAGIGVHNLDINAYIEGETIVNGETGGVERREESASQILPNVGAWYNFSPAKRWLLHARVDWISANIGDYDGTLWNTSVGVNFQAWSHVGFDLSWQYFNLNINVDKSDWTGGADLTYSGPVLGMTFNW